MRYVYPAIIKPDAEFNDWFQATFPDLDCSTDGIDDLYYTLVRAAELLNKHMIELEDTGKEIPAATYIKDVEVSDGEIVTLIKADTDAYRLLRAKMLIP